MLALITEHMDETIKKLKEHQVNFIVDQPQDCPLGKDVLFAGQPTLVGQNGLPAL